MISDKTHWVEKSCCHACANDHTHFLNNLSTYLSAGHLFLFHAKHYISSPSRPPLAISVVPYCTVCMFVCMCMGRCTPQNVYCMRLCPQRFKLLSSRHGSTTEVGFTQVCVQNDTSSTAYYNALILSRLYRGGEEDEED